MGAAKSKAIYVERIIDADIDKLWNYTQTPDKHEQWDLRFTQISYLPKSTEREPQRFLYQTRIGFGLTISGTGQTQARVDENDGVRLSTLTFGSEESLSLIRKGGGYWKYVPHQGRTRFLTRYDYSPRWGLAGFWLDRWLFRPLISWATAWSFDCLRLWLDKELPPRISTRLSLIYTSLLVVIAAIWVWHGLVPKWIYPEAGEQQLLETLGVFPGHEKAALRMAGTAEIAMGMILLLGHRYRWLYGVIIFLLIVLGGTAWIGDPAVLTRPFNPLTFNLALAACSLANWMLHPYVPMASRCLTKEPIENKNRT